MLLLDYVDSGVWECAKEDGMFEGGVRASGGDNDAMDAVG
jgi:hypothetical protein